MKLENIPAVSQEEIQYFQDCLLKQLVRTPIEEIELDANLKKAISAGTYMVIEAIKDGESEADVSHAINIVQVAVLMLVDRVLEAQKLAKIYG